MSNANVAPLTRRAAWAALGAHYARVKDLHLRSLFADDPQRAERFTLEAAGLRLDYSKNRITAETIPLLLQLAEESGLRARIDAMFRGDKINPTEKRAVLHVALRAPAGTSIMVDGTDVVPEVHAVLDAMSAFADRVRERQPGPVTPGSASATSSTSASAAPTSARSWPTKRCASTASAR